MSFTFEKTHPTDYEINIRTGEASSKLKSNRPAFRIKGGVKDGEIVYVNDGKRFDGDFTEIVVSDGIIQPIPSYKERECFMIAAPSGVGKTCFMTQFANSYRKKYPSREIVAITPKEEDASLQPCHPLKLSISEENFIDPDEMITLDECENSCILFDDIETLDDLPDIQKGIIRFRNKCLKEGRHKGISVLATVHECFGNSYTKPLSNECHYFVFFPNSSMTYQVNEWLKKYGGLTREQIKFMNKIPSRYVIFHRGLPRYVMGRDCAYII